MDGPFKICTPKGGLSNEQSVRIVLAYLSKNPLRLNEYKGYLIMDAFLEAYPCK
jgi:hypothetical protein